MKTPVQYSFNVFVKHIVILLCVLCADCTFINAQNYAIGAGLSIMKQAEDNGLGFKENGQVKPCLQIFKDHGYNWKPPEYIGKNAPFPEAPEDQKEFLEEVNRIVLSVPDNRGAGIFWWEPAVARNGSRSYFNDDGNVLPVITVFDRYTRK
jgi:arabinogalactan endo-1,4-beta-galactosidase